MRAEYESRHGIFHNPSKADGAFAATGRKRPLVVPQSEFLRVLGGLSTAYSAVKIF
jgi:hypothetical protein